MGTGLHPSSVEQTPTESSKITGHHEMTPMRGNGGTHNKSPSSEMRGKGFTPVWKKDGGAFSQRLPSLLSTVGSARQAV